MALRKVLDRLPGRRGRAVPAAEPDVAVPPSELEQRRSVLAREFAALQFDLGGLAYEMASRDHFRLDALVRQAARVQAVDADLGEVERLLHLEQAGAAGSCLRCGALHARGAVFCWKCGADLAERTRAGTPEGDDGPPGEAPSAPASPATANGETPAARSGDAPAPAPRVEHGSPA